MLKANPYAPPEISAARPAGTSRPFLYTCAIALGLGGLIIEVVRWGIWIIIKHDPWLTGEFLYGQTGLRVWQISVFLAAGSLLVFILFLAISMAGRPLKTVSRVARFFALLGLGLVPLLNLTILPAFVGFFTFRVSATEVPRGKIFGLVFSWVLLNLFNMRAFSTYLSERSWTGWYPGTWTVVLVDDFMLVFGPLIGVLMLARITRDATRGAHGDVA